MYCLPCNVQRTMAVIANVVWNLITNCWNCAALIISFLPHKISNCWLASQKHCCVFVKWHSQLSSRSRRNLPQLLGEVAMNNYLMSTSISYDTEPDELRCTASNLVSNVWLSIGANPGWFGVTTPRFWDRVFVQECEMKNFQQWWLFRSRIICV